ncbi:hypothetical protein [Streptococcus minor]|uniref:hypothetical protein n=1 Tax=Streptococcus minor TaxID=229549 RepID=UPI000365D42F|nr:hypothetical protein [Streptococcus minor]
MNKKEGNALLGLIGLATVGYILYVLSTWLLEVLSILKTYDAVIVVAIITGFVTITTTTLKAIWDIKQSRLHYLTQKREVAYFHFVEMIYKINQSTKDGADYSSEEQIADLIKFSKEITLWGSKKVVEHWMEFRKEAVTKSDGKKLLKISEQLMNEMRNDLGVQKVKEKALLSFFINDIENLD